VISPRALAKVPVQRCRFCDCTPEDPCKLPNGDECAYMTSRANRCNKPSCILAFEAERRREWREETQRLKRQLLLRDLRRRGKQPKHDKKWRPE
jgi:hypothetical protein